MFALVVFQYSKKYIYSTVKVLSNSFKIHKHDEILACRINCLGEH